MRAAFEGVGGWCVGGGDAGMGRTAGSEGGAHCFLIHNQFKCLNKLNMANKQEQD